MLLAVAVLQSGCVSNRYRMVKKGAVPPEPINLALATEPVGVTLSALITYHGPGSWKRDALWDEYVVTLHNPGPERITLTAASLTDHFGTIHELSYDPWALEKASQTLEQRYKAAGIAFVRYTVPGVLIAGAGVAMIYSAGVGLGGLSAGAATAATVTVLALPVYYLTVLGINHNNKRAIVEEFKRRRLVLPLTLGPGETRTGSLFFPMMVSPRELALGWRRAGEKGTVTLPLEFLKGLHLELAPAAPSAKADKKASE